MSRIFLSACLVSLSGLSDGQGPWGGHQHDRISCPAYPAIVFKRV